MCTWTLIVNLFVWTNHWKWKHTKLWPSWFPNHIRLDRIPSNQVCAMEHILYCLGFPDHIRLDRVPSNQVCAMEHIPTVLVSQTIFVWTVYPPTRSALWSLYTYCLYLPIRSRVPIALESFDYICLNRSVLQNLPHSFGIVSCCGSLHENNRGIEYTVRTLQ